jgi:hypothetical protein
VNLRSDSITGPIIDSTAPVALPDSFGLPLNTGYVTFFFGNRVPLQAGVTYFLQPVVQSGDLFGIFGGTFNYPGGELYSLGVGTPLTDYWFREGIVVPEPSVTALIFPALGIFVFAQRRR